MSGAKRKGKYRKSITDDYLNDLPLPSPSDGEVVAQCQGARGSNIFEIALTDTEVSEKSGLHLSLLPNKFRNVIWVKTRDFLILESAASDAETMAESSSSTGKVKYIIKHILNKNSVKNIEKAGLWPAALTNPYSQNSNAKLAPVTDTDDTGVNDTVFGIETGSKMGGGYLDDLLMPGYQEAEEEEEVLYDKRGNIITTAEIANVQEETAP